MNKEKLKPGTILENVVDIFGNEHKRVAVISDLNNTVTGQDLDTMNRRVFHKLDLNLEMAGKKSYESDVSKKGFNLDESHRLGYDEQYLSTATTLGRVRHKNKN